MGHLKLSRWVLFLGLVGLLAACGATDTRNEVADVPNIDDPGAVVSFVKRGTVTLTDITYIDAQDNVIPLEEWPAEIVSLQSVTECGNYASIAAYSWSWNAYGRLTIDCPWGWKFETGGGDITVTAPGGNSNRGQSIEGIGTDNLAVRSGAVPNETGYYTLRGYVAGYATYPLPKALAVPF
jgi:hypothetical protein